MNNFEMSFLVMGAIASILFFLSHYFDNAKGKNEPEFIKRNQEPFEEEKK